MAAASAAAAATAAAAAMPDTDAVVFRPSGTNVQTTGIIQRQVLPPMWPAEADAQYDPSIDSTTTPGDLDDGVWALDPLVDSDSDVSRPASTASSLHHQEIRNSLERVRNTWIITGSSLESGAPVAHRTATGQQAAQLQRHERARRGTSCGARFCDSLDETPTAVTYMRFIAFVTATVGIGLMFDLLSVGWDVFSASEGYLCRVTQLALRGRFIRARFSARLELLDRDASLEPASCIFNHWVDLKSSHVASLKAFAEDVDGGTSELIFGEHWCILNPQFAKNGKCDFGAGTSWLGGMPAIRIWAIGCCGWMMLGPGGICTLILRLWSAFRPSSKPKLACVSCEFCSNNPVLRLLAFELLLLSLHIPVFVFLCHLYAKREYIQEFAEEPWSWEGRQAGTYTYYLNISKKAL